ncbi:hypothetical protein OG883_30265 [Streptomyces sp. NBC_01142]|uniref:hypothetical protein n=1 Tax=Streptomyces sp. NBC_01142 TaxID=2975865 RepID=UPI002257694E|nr:hypothetical protein [Streptomyces sp. NBC_01142]MCX4824081.1 hypothetical protein [Streptomyces sp. NBC_01142]
MPVSTSWIGQTCEAGWQTAYESVIPAPALHRAGSRTVSRAASGRTTPGTGALDARLPEVDTSPLSSGRTLPEAAGRCWAARGGWR